MPESARERLGPVTCGARHLHGLCRRRCSALSRQADAGRNRSEAGKDPGADASPVTILAPTPIKVLGGLPAQAFARGVTKNTAHGAFISSRSEKHRGALRQNGPWPVYIVELPL
jgi:hypothetical protein